MRTSRDKLSVKVDYLSIIFDKAKAKEVITKLINLPIWTFKSVIKGVKHKSYTMCYEMGYIHIYGDCAPTEDNPNGLGAYLVMSGKGCDELQLFLNAQRMTFGDFFQKCDDLFGENNYHLTRLDIAIDDTNDQPFFTMEQLKNKCLKEEFESRSKTYSFDESSYELGDTAKSVYIGVRKSQVMYRFYDKEKEQLQKNPNALLEGSSWKRTELQLRDGIAHGFADKLASGDYELGNLTFDFLGNNLRFLVEDKEEKDKKKWKTWRPWERFLGAVKPLKIVAPREESTLYDKQNWMEYGGGLAGVKAFQLLEEHNALGDLKEIGDMYQNIKFGSDLCRKLVAHLSLIGREDLIPLVYEETKK